MTVTENRGGDFRGCAATVEDLRVGEKEQQQHQEEEEEQEDSLSTRTSLDEEEEEDEQEAFLSHLQPPPPPPPPDHLTANAKGPGGGAGSADEDMEAPLEGGWGWCVVLAGAVCMMVVGAQGPCFGVLYGQRLDQLGASPDLAAWLFNLQALAFNLAGPWAGPLTEVFSSRQIAVVGGLLSAVSLFLSALVTNAYLLLITFSVMSGVGGGLTILCCYHMSSRYFRRRLGLANCLMVAGGSLGVMFLPQLASHLQQLYPFRWATFIIGAIVLHAPVAALLFHPVSWHRKKTARDDAEVPDTKYVAPNTRPSTIKHLTNPKISDLTDVNGNTTTHCQNQGTVGSEAISATAIQAYTSRRVSGGAVVAVRRLAKYEGLGLPRRSSAPHLPKFQEAIFPSLPIRYRTCSESVTQREAMQEAQLGLDASRVGGSTYMGSFLAVDHLHHQECVEDEEAAGGERAVGRCARVWRRFRAQYNLQEMKEPQGVGIALASCLSITAAINIFVIMPLMLRETGFSLQEAATAMSVGALVDLCSRLLAAPITDLPFVSPRILYCYAQLIYIIAPFAVMTGASTGRWSVVAGGMAVLGHGLGIFFVLDVLLIVKVLGPGRLTSVFGLSQFLRCVTFTTQGLVAGQLRKVTGSYVASLVFLSCVVVGGLICLACTAFLARKHKNSVSSSSIIVSNSSAI